jgi:hypothetical protein
MKRSLICFSAFLLASCLCVAGSFDWDPARATAEADHDIRTGHIKFYWAGTEAAEPVGVPRAYYHVSERYPHGDAGIGCIVLDQEFRKKQAEYARRYNAKMLTYVLHRH